MSNLLRSPVDAVARDSGAEYIRRGPFGVSP